MTDLNALIERLEKAIGPDRELDGDIAISLGLPPPNMTRRADGWCWYEQTAADDFDSWEAPAYTSSIESAVALIESGAWWEIVQTCAHDSPMRNFSPRNGMFRARTAKSFGVNGATGEHDIPAIALCIAALKAKSRSPQP